MIFSILLDVLFRICFGSVSNNVFSFFSNVVPRSTIDDEYTNANERDPKILLTTSHDPSAPLKQFVKVCVYIKLIIFKILCYFLSYKSSNNIVWRSHCLMPLTCRNWSLFSLIHNEWTVVVRLVICICIMINVSFSSLGCLWCAWWVQVISEIVETCRSHDFTDLILVHEHRGVPDNIIISHLPFGPTAYFQILNVVSVIVLFACLLSIFYAYCFLNSSMQVIIYTYLGHETWQ